MTQVQDKTNYDEFADRFKAVVFEAQAMYGGPDESVFANPEAVAALFQEYAVTVMNDPQLGIKARALRDKHVLSNTIPKSLRHHSDFVQGLCLYLQQVEINDKTLKDFLMLMSWEQNFYEKVLSHIHSRLDVGNGSHQVA